MTSPRRQSIARVVVRVEAGAAGGLAAAIAVAILFFVQGAISLHPFAVPVSLASGLFSGANGGQAAIGQPQSFIVLTLQMLAYTVLHLLAFAGVGAMAGLIVRSATFWRSALGGAAFATVACTALLYLARWFLGAPVAVDVLGLPRVLLVNAAAGAIIGTALYLGEQSYAREREALS